MSEVVGAHDHVEAVRVLDAAAAAHAWEDKTPHVHSLHGRDTGIERGVEPWTYLR